MAIWQVDMHVIHASDEPPNTINDGWQPPLLSGALLLQAQQMLTEYLGAPWTMVEDWVVFGPENGSRVDVVFETANSASIVVRFDVRNDGVQFPALICKLAQKLGCLLFSADLGSLIEPNGATLAVALDNAHNAAVLRNLNIG
jgi:hypothetical protein